MVIRSHHIRQIIVITSSLIKWEANIVGSMSLDFYYLVVDFGDQDIEQHQCNLRSLMDGSNQTNE